MSKRRPGTRSTPALSPPPLAPSGGAGGPRPPPSSVARSHGGSASASSPSGQDASPAPSGEDATPAPSGEDASPALILSPPPASLGFVESPVQGPAVDGGGSEEPEAPLVVASSGCVWPVPQSSPTEAISSNSGNSPPLQAAAPPSAASEVVVHPAKNGMVVVSESNFETNHSAPVLDNIEANFSVPGSVELNSDDLPTISELPGNLECGKVKNSALQEGILLPNVNLVIPGQAVNPSPGSMDQIVYSHKGDSVQIASDGASPSVPAIGLVVELSGPPLSKALTASANSKDADKEFPALLKDPQGATPAGKKTAWAKRSFRLPGKATSGKLQWPELVGKPGCKAATIITRENSNVHPIVLPGVGIFPITSDYHCGRVRVFIDNNGNVNRTPTVG